MLAIQSKNKERLICKIQISRASKSPKRNSAIECVSASRNAGTQDIVPDRFHTSPLELTVLHIQLTGEYHNDAIFCHHYVWELRIQKVFLWELYLSMIFKQRNPKKK